MYNENKYNKHNKKVKTKTKKQNNDIKMNQNNENQMNRQYHYQGHMDSEDNDQKIIAHYENKLKIKGKKKLNSISKTLGMDDDIFEFLDNVQQIVKDNKNKHQYKQTQIKNKTKTKKINKNKIIISNESKSKNQIKENLQNKNYTQNGKIEKEVKIVQQYNTKNQFNVSEQQIIIRKQLTSKLNKLSDGNLLLTFRNLIQLINKIDFNKFIKHYNELFIKFVIEIQKPIQYIFITNIALLVGLYRVYGNKLLSSIIYSSTKKYIQLSNKQQNIKQVEELGYSKIQEYKKNYIKMICYLYQYQTITAQYILSLCLYLSKSQTITNIQLLYLILQQIGHILRNNNISILKGIINLITTLISKYKSISDQNNNKKINFIENQLNSIKFNKKINYQDHRLDFIKVFINRNVQQQCITCNDIFMPNFQNVCTANTDEWQWWNPYNTQPPKQQLQTPQIPLNSSQTELLSLAKKLHLVTQSRQQIFIHLMTSSDYIQATQRILTLKTKVKQDIAIVVFVTCLNQDTYNPFYALVISKLCELDPKFRISVQYTFWDHLKQLQNYQLRKIHNLGKLIAWIIASPISDCSLSMLKYFPDIGNLIQTHQHIFMEVFFKEFLKKIKKPVLVKLAAKLMESNNALVKEGLKDYVTNYNRKLQKDSKLNNGGKSTSIMTKIMVNAKILKNMLLIKRDEQYS